MKDFYILLYAIGFRVRKKKIGDYSHLIDFNFFITIKLNAKLSLIFIYKYIIHGIYDKTKY